jgi:hypothetical protein
VLLRDLRWKFSSENCLRCKLGIQITSQFFIGCFRSYSWKIINAVSSICVVDVSR